MVNYCCVYGCGRNSRQHKNLIFYNLPREKHRQIKWLKIAGREDMLERDLSKLSKRFCSRHFLPSSIKNKHLCPDATPSLFLPGSCGEEDIEIDDHSNILCNSCCNSINGFRYKCVTCPDVDLCQKCEMLEVHRNHCMVRIPKPMTFALTEKLVKELQSFISTEVDADFSTSTNNQQVIEKVDFESSDDEPITKYVVEKQYDSGIPLGQSKSIDLTDEVKERIRKEVSRVLDMKRKTPKKKTVVKKRSGQEIERSKRLRSEEYEEVNNVVASVPELAFADVNDITETQIDMKRSFSFQQETSSDDKKLVAHVKLSNDLSQVVIEVLQDEKTENMYQ